MLRLFPYVIVFLAIFSFSKFMEILNSKNEMHSLVQIFGAHADTETKPTNDADKLKDPKENILNDNTETKQNANEAASNSALPSGINKEYQSDKNCTLICMGEGVRLPNYEGDILQNLSARRHDLQKYEEQISVKESALGVLKKSVDDKISQLEILQDKIQSLIKVYDEKKNNDLTKLVRMYENMKPKEAARIFNELQISVLLEITEKMKELKLGTIVGEMLPTKAKELTVALANKRKIIEIESGY